MRQYLVVRLAQVVPVLFLASIAIWGLIYLLPGDPALVILGQNAQPAQVAALRAQLGLDQPLPEQYLSWLGRVLQGNFGISYQTGLPVMTLIGPRVVATLQLAVLAFVLSVIIGVPLGVIAASHP